MPIFMMDIRGSMAENHSQLALDDDWLVTPSETGPATIHKDAMSGTPENISKNDPKALGAFYTDAQVAEFLVWWAVRSRAETVIDPSFGGGVFLRAACK